MTNQPTLDDTQPKSPFRDLPGEGRRPPKLIDPNEPSRRAGCGMMGLIGAMLMVFALLIVGLAGVAGWTTGQREAGVAATATLRAVINEQLARIPDDIASGNTVLLDTRIRYLATLGVPQANDYIPTATALFLSLQPTLTPTITPTAPVTPTTAAPEITDAPELQVASVEDGGYDLAGIYQQALTAYGAGLYEDASEYLNVILAVNETYQPVEVRNLMSQALNAHARELYNANQPAAANLVVDRARTYGDIGELDYESYAATLYLNARGALGTDYNSAINALREVIALGAGGRYYGDSVQLLFQQYVAYGDAWGAQGSWCPAEQQYRNALNVLSSGSVNAKLQQAINFCMNGTPTPDPLSGQPGAIPGGQPIAPIGQPGT